MIRQNFRRVALLTTLVCLFALAFSSTALAQTLMVDDTTVAFTVPSGGVTTKQIHVSTDESTSIFINTNNTQSWLSVNPSGPTNVLQGTPTTLNLTANATNLTPGPYSTTFTVAVESVQNTPITVTVNLTVAGTSVLSANPGTLSFQVSVGTAESNVPTQNVLISSSGPQLSFTVSASTTDGNSWLIPVTTFGTTSGSPNITVGVNPAGLPAAMYSGTILVQSTQTSDSVAISVTLTITAAQTLSATPPTVSPFLFQIGSTPQAGQLTRTIMISSTNASTAFSATLSPQVSWLVVNPPTGATGAGGTGVPVTLTANATGLTPGVYTTQLNFSVIGGVSLSPIPVMLVVSNNPLLQLSTNTLTFSSNFGATTPPPSQSVQVSTTGNGNTSFTFSSNEPWLTATTTGNMTPAVLTVTANPTGLAVGPYTGTLTVVPNNSDMNLYSLTITVSFTVGSTSQVTAGPPLLVFSVETGQPAPGVQDVELQATGQGVTFGVATSTVTASNCPPNWLTASPSATSVSSTAPATIVVGIVSTGMTVGMCSGSVVITYPAVAANPSTITIPVLVNVSAASEITISQPLGFGAFTAIQGGVSQSAILTLGSTDGSPVSFSVSAMSNGGPSPWLFVGSNGSLTPQTLQVQIIPGSLLPNTYSGSITITSPTLASGPVTIPGTLTISPSVTVSISGTGTLNFTQAVGGPVPTSQGVTLTSSGSGASFQVSVPSTAACSWLKVTPTSGAANGAVSFIPQANSLPQNTYACPVTFSFIGSATASITENAILTVTASQTVSVSTSALTFTYQIGGTAPAPQNLMVTSTGGAVGFTVGTTSTGGWLTTSAGSSTLQTPQTIGVSIIPANIPSSATAGSTLAGTIMITAPGVLSTPITVTVSLNLTAAATPTPIIIFNSATGALGSGISAGELITIKGVNLGPTTAATFTVTAQNTVSSTLGGVQVMFGSFPGTPTYVSSSQINVVVPWEISGSPSTTIVVSVNGVPSAGFPENVIQDAPGVYTLNATGSGQAAALNQNFSINGPSTGVPLASGTIPTTPAAGGTVIAVFGTGGGLTSPQGVTGTITPTNQLYPLANWTPGSNVVTASIGGKVATVTFAGAAPGEITGVIQVNIIVPTGLTPGNQTLVITINGVETQANVTIATD
jgi:trimeric autotransporter adhesin